MIKINSLTNDHVKHVVHLHSAKYRSQFQEFIAEGFRTISTIIKAGHTPISLFVTEEFLYDAKQLTNEKLIIIVAPDVMNKMSSSKTPSGLLAIFHIPAQPAFSTLGTGIVLAQVTDPGNMGTLIRTAAAMNKKTVVCVETVDPWNPKVVQATAGAIANVDIFRLNWPEIMLNKKNIPLLALVPSEGKHPNGVNLRQALIVVGSEAH